MILWLAVFVCVCVFVCLIVNDKDLLFWRHPSGDRYLWQYEKVDLSSGPQGAISVLRHILSVSQAYPVYAWHRLIARLSENRRFSAGLATSPESPASLNAGALALIGRQLGVAGGWFKLGG